jgi:transcriptional antiterminator Rof (Rho-off)
MSEYRVIDCDLHDLYEIAILRRRRLLLNWRDLDGLAHLELLLPLDIRTRPDGEFLILSRADGRRTEIRLDTILHARDPASGEDFPVRPHQSGT